MAQITRKQFFAAGAAPLARPVQSSRTRRPRNVLLLMSDQHRPHALSIDGNPVARTPNLDALARSGVRFDDAYCTNPVCTPSRASLLTGLYTHSHRTWNNSTPWPFEIKTVAHHFGRAGYMSALIGKMHFVDAQSHGFDYLAQFNDWYQYLGPKTRLYAEELGHANSGSGMPQIDDLWRDFGDPWLGVREKDNREGPVHPGRISKIPERDHFDSFVAREAVRFLKNHGRQQPFFLVASFLKPHDPFMPAERFAAMFRAEDMQLPPTWGKVNLETVPREIRESIRRNRPTPELRDPAVARRRIALYYASIAQMDDCAGQVLRALSESGLEQDTLVLYLSDHGEMLAEHGLWQKFVFYEPSVGVPLIIRVPGMTAAGARSATPVSLADIVPTLCELCGVSYPAGLDGTSIIPDLREPGRIRDRAVFAEFNLRTPRAKYMIRRGHYKYSYYLNDIAEMYNLREDPAEMRNLALLPEFKSKTEAMRAELFAWHKPQA